MWEDSTEPMLVHSLLAHRGEVACADVSGALLATGGGDGSLRLWRWRRGAGWAEELAESRAHRYGVTAARWAASGALLASAGVDGAARVWSRRLAVRRALAAPGAAAARALCWAAARLLVGHDDGALCVWSVPHGMLLARLVPCDGALHALTTLARDAMLLVACTSGTLKVFDLDEVYGCGVSGREAPTPLLWEDGAHDLGALCAAADAEGATAATGGHDARIRLWGAGPRRRVAAGGVLCGHTAAVTGLRWARGPLLASASLDRTARLWAARTLTCVRVLHAHARYLTCVALSPDLRYLLTGSNDRTMRTWSLSGFTIDDDVEPPCSVLSHYGLGDLEGIQPIENEELYEEGLVSAADGGEGSGFNEAILVWNSKDAHNGAINSIATYNDLLVTACSDGAVRLFRWSESLQTLMCERVLAAHRYPAMAVDLGAAGALLLSAGLDGRARLWDVQSGCELLSLSGESVGGGESGGGGVRGARVSPHRPPLLLLVTDDGAVAVWSIEQAGSEPIHVYEPFPEAATCCAWAGDGRLCAAGGGAALRLLAAPPAARTLHAHTAAHDLGVLSCEFAPKENANESNTCLLASAGRDALLKVWKIQLEDDSNGEPRAVLSLLSCLEAHGGAVESVRWDAVAGGGGARLATSGADGWARAWWVSAGGSARALAAVPAGGATGATAAAVLGASMLAAGTLAGELALWRLPATNEGDDDYIDAEGAAPRQWGAAGVARWLSEYVTRVPGSPVSAELESAALQRARGAGLTGARLLDEPVEDLLSLLQPLDLENKENPDIEDEIGKKEGRVGLATCGQLCARLREELEWLRREPPGQEAEARAPHALRCPLTHALLREPARAADGFTYERANILDYFLAADGALSPLTGRRMRSARVAPNFAVRQQLRDFVASLRPGAGAALGGGSAQGN